MEVDEDMSPPRPERPVKTPVAPAKPGTSKPTAVNPANLDVDQPEEFEGFEVDDTEKAEMDFLNARLVSIKARSKYYFK